MHQGGGQLIWRKLGSQLIKCHGQSRGRGAENSASLQLVLIVVLRV